MERIKSAEVKQVMPKWSRFRSLLCSSPSSGRGGEKRIEISKKIWDLNCGRVATRLIVRACVRHGLVGCQSQEIFEVKLCRPVVSAMVQPWRRCKRIHCARNLKRRAHNLWNPTYGVGGRAVQRAVLSAHNLSHEVGARDTLPHAASRATCAL